MAFIMDGLAAESYDRSYSDGVLIRRVVGYFRPHGVRMGVASAAILLTAGLDAVLPVLLSAGLDRLAGMQGGVALWQESRGLLALIVAVAMLSWTLGFVRQWVTAIAVGDVVLDLRRDAFDAVLARDMSFYDEVPAGKVVSRVTSDTQAFSSVVTHSLTLLGQAGQVVLVAAILIAINPWLAAITLSIAPVVVVVALGFRAVARRTTTQSRRVQAEVNATVQESIAGIAVAKAFRQEAALYETFREVNDHSYRLRLQQGLVFSTIFPVLGILGGLGTAAVVYLGGHTVLGGLATPGEWYLFVHSIFLFLFPLTGVASFWSQFQLGLAASERVFALIDAEPAVRQQAAVDPGRLAGQISFCALDFHYQPSEPVLTGFDLEIAAGETVALVGHTGAGKSSIGKLVARSYEFQGGALTIDGHDIRSLDLHAWRRQLGVVPQSPFLFSGTVRDNIRYARAGVTDAAVADAVARIGGGDWAEALERGLDTDVGERGAGISMGQRQLVTLARVLVQDPAILILDEATASIDPLTEAQIQEGLREVLQGRTALVIAHRLSTIQRADRIVVLGAGQVIETGTHERLMATTDGHYQALYNTYFRHQSPDYDPRAGVA